MFDDAEAPRPRTWSDFAHNLSVFMLNVIVPTGFERGSIAVPASIKDKATLRDDHHEELRRLTQPSLRSLPSIRETAPPPAYSRNA